MSEAYVTLATNDEYSVGCLVLAKSLRVSGTRKELAVMVTSGVSRPMLQQLQIYFNLVKEVKIIDSSDMPHLNMLGRPELGITLTKINCWLMTNYTKCVFMDADTMVLKCVDELFSRDEISAAPDAGWPDCFNSGVFVYTPSETTYESLLQLALSSGSFDGGDQGLLNMFFRDWSRTNIDRHLPFTYNVVAHAFYSYLPAYTQFRGDVKVVHFIGPIKPWHHVYDLETNQLTVMSETAHSREYLEKWWRLFSQFILPKFTSELRQFALSLSSQTPLPVSVDQKQLTEPPTHQQSWEIGLTDYMGKDQFVNIQEKLDNAMAYGTGGNLIDASTAPFPAFTRKTEAGVADVSLMTDGRRFCDAFMQVTHAEILAALATPEPGEKPQPGEKPESGEKPEVSDGGGGVEIVSKASVETTTGPPVYKPDELAPIKRITPPVPPHARMPGIKRPAGDSDKPGISTRVDVDNPNRFLTTVTADPYSNARFRVKSVNGVNGDKTALTDDDVKMMMEFHCNYTPKKIAI